MKGAFLQSMSRNFISLGYGTIKSVTKLEIAYEKFKTEYKDPCLAQDKNKLQNRINKIIAQLRALNKLLNNILKLIQKILTFSKFLQKLVIALLLLSKLLKLFPLPSRWTTVGLIVKMGDLLAKITFQLKAALLIITGVDLIVRYIASFIKDIITRINDLISKLKLVVDQLKTCDKKMADELSNPIATLENTINDLNTQLGTLLTNNNSYKGFTFEIIEEETTDQVVAKRRYAVAINTLGILTLQGTPSFATDTKVLIDELKLIIDSQNLSGYPVNQTVNGLTPSSIIPDLEEDVREELDLDSTEDMIEESIESQKELDSLIENEAGEKKLKEKYNKKQKRFVRFLEKKAKKGNDKAKELLDKINKKSIDVAQAQVEWLSHKSDKLLGLIT